MATQDEMLRVRVPRDLWARLERLTDEDNKRTRSDVARDLIEAGLTVGIPGRTPSLRAEATLDAREVVLTQVDALNNVLELVAGADPREAIRLAMDAAIAFSRWAELAAKELGTTTAEVYRDASGNLS